MSLKSEVKQMHNRGKTHDAKAFFTKKAEFNYSTCVLCTAPHRKYACDQFNKMSVKAATVECTVMCTCE